jgi:8-oxo-dGTP diphosphatase
MRKTARALVIKDDQILLMYRNKYNHEYYTLVGGEIEMNEDPVVALNREVFEETSLKIDQPRLIIEENAGPIYGYHYIYWCHYVEGEIGLRPESIEQELNQNGQNIFKPIWLPVNKLEHTNLLPKELKLLLIDMLKNGFPDKPVQITADFTYFNQKGE